MNKIKYIFLSQKWKWIDGELCSRKEKKEEQSKRRRRWINNYIWLSEPERDRSKDDLTQRENILYVGFNQTYFSLLIEYPNEQNYLSLSLWQTHR